MQHQLEAKRSYPGINVIKEYGDIPLVNCYAGHLNQVFMNILSNAIDALEERVNQNSELKLNLQIRIRTEFSQPYAIIIRIADNGLGIPEAIQKQIFDPFFTTKPIGKGTGLGLSTSYQIMVEKHGGVLKYLTQPGKGTEFWLEIPYIKS